MKHKSHADGQALKAMSSISTFNESELIFNFTFNHLLCKNNRENC